MRVGRAVSKEEEEKKKTQDSFHCMENTWLLVGGCY